MKNKIYLSFVVSLAFLSWSCNKFLEEDLVSDVSATHYYTTEKGFQDAVNATYSRLKVFYGQEIGFTMTTFGTDIFTNGSDGGHKFFNLYDGTLDPSGSFVRDAWKDWYKGINQANAVIHRSEELEMDEALKNVRLAEVHFLRALFYFNIVTTYGDAHLSLEETEGMELEANRTASAEIYKQAIVPDLEFAVANLPDTQSDYGRATKAAAEFLLGKVLLTRSYTSYADGNDATRSEALFTNVIENYGFSLLRDYGDLWDIENQENQEIIFSVINSKTQVDDGTDESGHRAHLFFLMEYDVLPGMKRDVKNGRPWKRFKPTDFLLSLWDRDKDTRYDKGFTHVWYTNNPNETLQTGDTAVYIPGPGKDQLWPESRQDSKPYMVITHEEYTERFYPSMLKWLDPTRPDHQKEQGQRNHILMRLADAYLLRAEARLQQNNTAGAAEDVNTVRRRAAKGGMETEMEVTATRVNLDFILDERARELYGEGYRWWDLVRTGKLVERVRLYNPAGAVNIKDYHVLRPIPQDQIDRTLNEYPQNPGYPN
ncbi:RagB/SusD family nutrient uptake outer membrane protein [Sinomicrobium weinanense]|uniref:RagB/SusD family nutrient uptake outer membrane protein n=1 Tax=Sinomicrobium weinanense TaxID=2842200 RepID=A0A926JPA8_9FLAO|nr:RagB/SusD family nutrient uptake outer membrane protein [Sinomicrobium weinanense]MBC9794985.1 RagB/SusD family nutrient uptake outer membrane protein [Sinomicrobium weinanense]MBU3125154.1 RagB/SusD family nutrient uptake outer membrane protein [Sinomicrobium weinanense]